MSALTEFESAAGRDRHNPMRLPLDQEEHIQRWLKMAGQPVPKQIIICPLRWDDTDMGVIYSYLGGLYEGLDGKPDEWRPL